MDNTISEKTFINNYNEIFNNLIKFNNNIQKTKKNIFNVNLLFNNKNLENLNLNKEFLSFKSDIIPIIDYTNKFNFIIIFKNENLKNYLTIEINSPYYDYLDNKNIFNEFYLENFFYKLINLKNKYSNNEIINEDYDLLKKEYEYILLNNNEKLKNIQKQNNLFYDKYINLQLQDLLMNKIYSEKYLDFKKNPDSKKINLLLMYNLLLSSYSLNHNHYVFYKDKFYFKVNDKKYYNYNNQTELNDRNKKYKFVDKSEHKIPINNKIFDIKNKIKSNIVYDNSNNYEEDFKTYINIQLFKNKNNFEKFINENVFNKNRILNNYNEIKKPIEKKEKINFNLLKSKNNMNEFIINTDNPLHYSNIDYSFVYNDYLWSSINHCMIYNYNNDHKYTINYDDLYSFKKNKNEFLGYSKNIIMKNFDYNINVIENKILQNENLIKILLDTNDKILIDNDNNELKELMQIRNNLLNKNYNLNQYKLIKENYINYYNLLNDFSKIIIKFMNDYENDTQLSKLIIKEIEKNKYFNKFKSKFLKNYNDIFDIIKYNYFLL